MKPPIYPYLSLWFVFIADKVITNINVNKTHIKQHRNAFISFNTSSEHQFKMTHYLKIM